MNNDILQKSLECHYLSKSKLDSCNTKYWMNNYIHVNLWDVQQLNLPAFEVRAWKHNYISLFFDDVNTFACPELHAGARITKYNPC